MPTSTRRYPPPYWSAPEVELYLGDVRVCLRQLPTRSVHCVVTSPPYWGLRSYHNTEDVKHLEIGMEDIPDCLGWATGNPCSACYVCHLVEVFGEIRRVLRDDGTVWLNLGDTFNDGQGMVPAAVAMALRADGWKLVQDIIWHAPNKMPESVQNRCTKSHEHIFLLVKGPGYYYDSVAIEEPVKSKPHTPGWASSHEDRRDRSAGNIEDSNIRIWGDSSKNKRDVWIVPTQGYPDAHFAVFSPRLITPCVLAGTSEYGCCAACKAPYERIISKTGGQTNEKREDANNLSRDRSFNWSRNGKPGTGSTLDGVTATRETLGWRKTCGCQTTEVAPCVVLDPFVGSGTTVATAVQLGRAGVGIDLSEAYLRDNAVPRIEAALRGEKAPKPATVIVAMETTPPAPKRLR